jgi:hypothetical protein
MAAHKGPARLRPRCTWCGSSVATIPILPLQTVLLFNETGIHSKQCTFQKVPTSTCVLHVLPNSPSFHHLKTRSAIYGVPHYYVSFVLLFFHLCYTVRSGSHCALRLWYADLVVGIEVAVEVCCCFTVFSC